MILVDTHAHLYEDAFAVDRMQMIERSIREGVSKMIIPNVDASTITPMLDIVHQFPLQIFPMMGLHPCYVKPESYQQELEVVRSYLFEQKDNPSNNFVAVGEIGLDLFWDKTTLEIQKEAFEIQCDWAVELNLPVAIHSRDSTSVLIELLKKRKKNPSGVFHCFTGSLEEAHQIIDLGFFLGIGGVVTYKNTHLRDTLKQIPIAHIVLETDAPYLPPVPFRGQRNESSYTKIVAEALCAVYEKGLDEIASVTTLNACRLFAI